MTPFESSLIIAHETRRFRSALGHLRQSQEHHDLAEENCQRWMLPGFTSEVQAARKAFVWWTLTLITVAGSFLLNCLLVQELVPDFAALVERLTGWGEGGSRFIASTGLTAILFAVLLTIKWWGYTGQDRDTLRMALHPAVQRPLKFRIGLKTAIKAVYLTALAAGYFALYRYISGGAQLDAALQTTAEQMAESAQARLGDAGEAQSLTSMIDSEIASSQAASFAVYYTIEWALHALILFVGAPLWLDYSYSTALASHSRDRARLFRTRTETQSAIARLASILAPAVPDDGGNAVRKELSGSLTDEEYQQIWTRTGTTSGTSGTARTHAAAGN